MRETLCTISSKNNIDYVVDVKDKSNLKYSIIEDNICYITRIDKNKFFSRKETIQFSYSGIDLDHQKVKKILYKNIESQQELSYEKFIYFPQIVDNIITCLRFSPEDVYYLVKEFNSSSWNDKAMIIYQLYDSAEKIRKYERENTLITKESIIDQKLSKLQSITNSLDEL